MASIHLSLRKNEYLLDTYYKYGNDYSNVSDKTTDDVAEEWFVQIQVER